MTKRMKNKLKSVIRLSLLGMLPFFVSCSDRPSNVLSEDKMVKLMVDMELTEAYVNTNVGSSSKDRIDLGERVLKAHGVTEETLDTTLAWYGRNMDEYSQLFEKVDKEIEKRRKKYTEIPGEKQKEPDNLWPFGQHVIISPLSGSNSLTFNVRQPEIEKGDIIEFSSYLPNPTGIKGTFGVEYTDGHGEVMISSFPSKNKIQISLQTDSSRVVSRIFGVMSVKEISSLPLYLDSISLKAEPLDTLNYRSKRRSQKSFGPLP